MPTRYRPVVGGRLAPPGRGEELQTVVDGAVHQPARAQILQRCGAGLA